MRGAGGAICALRCGDLERDQLGRRRRQVRSSALGQEALTGPGLSRVGGAGALLRATYEW